MKILVVCQHYWPEPYPLPDVCEELVMRGHSVDVLTDVPNYPMGTVYPGYGRGQNRRQTHNGVRILRCFTVARRHNVIFRFLNYYSYSFSSTLRAMLTKDKYDVVFANQTSPVMMVRAAETYAKKHGVPCVLYCMDLWPACLAAGGISESSPVYLFYGKVSRKLYGKADRVLITSRMFRSYLRDKCGIPDSVIEYLPQYAESRFTPLPGAAGKQTVNLMFAGNVGAAQSLDTVLKAAELLKDEPSLRWHIVGDGSELEHLRAIAEEKQLTGVIFHGRLPIEQMPELYAQADAMLATLTADPFISLTLPNKVQTYMAAGKPVIACANGEIPQVIADAQCGFCAEAENERALADAVRSFLRCEDREVLGQNARTYYEAHFSRERFMDAVENELLEAVKQGGPK